MDSRASVLPVNYLEDVVLSEAAWLWLNQTTRVYPNGVGELVESGSARDVVRYIMSNSGVSLVPRTENESRDF